MAKIKQTKSFIRALKAVKVFFQLKGIPEQKIQALVKKEFLQKISRLKIFPQSGRSSEMSSNLRELLCCKGEYFVLYEYSKMNDTVYLIDIFSNEKGEQLG